MHDTEKKDRENTDMTESRTDTEHATEFKQASRIYNRMPDNLAVSI